MIIKASINCANPGHSSNETDSWQISYSSIYQVYAILQYYVGKLALKYPQAGACLDYIVEVFERKKHNSTMTEAEMSAFKDKSSKEVGLKSQESYKTVIVEPERIIAEYSWRLLVRLWFFIL